MRLLTRLLLAGAAAVTAWLLAGVVTLRAIDDPSRVGLLPGVHVFLVAFAGLLALSGAVGRPQRAAPMVALAAASSLPWWPVDWPPAVLLLTGPIGWAWLTLCLACVVEIPSGGWRWWRARRLLADPAIAPRLIGGAVAVLAIAMSIAIPPAYGQDDQPVARRLTQHPLVDDSARIDDPQRSMLPVPLSRGVALAGGSGAVAIMAVVAGLGAGLLWHLAWLVADSAGAAWFGTVAAVGAAPWFLPVSALSPAVPASVLLLVALWPIVEPLRFRGWRLVLPSLALVSLPWMHTRFVLPVVALGAVLVTQTWPTPRRQSPRLLLVLGPAAASALAWLVLAWRVDGAAARSGTLPQAGSPEIVTGLIGLCVDQQFGLLTTAPVIGLAACGMVVGWSRRAAPADAASSATRRLIVAFAGATALYLLPIGGDATWWGGWSAPARVLAPLVLPAGLLVALAWQAFRSHSSRAAASILLACSLGLTGAIVRVDAGRLVYDGRDGLARWADWASPLVDLTAALPSVHRDGPVLATRDATIWLGLAVIAWATLRLCERRVRVSRAMVLTATLSVGLLAPSAVWAVRGVAPWHPLRGQVDWLLSDAARADARPLLITPPSQERPRRNFDLDLMSAPARRLDPFTALQLDRLPPGRYRLFAVGLDAGTRLAVVVGSRDAASSIAETEVRQGRAVTEVLLPMAVERLVVHSSTPIVPGAARVWLRADDMHGASRGRVDAWDVAPAVRTLRFGEVRLFVQAQGVIADADGFWVADTATSVIGVTGPPRLPVTLRAAAGAWPIVLHTEVGSRRSRVTLVAGASTTVDVGRLPSRGTQIVRLRVEDQGRPASPDGGTRGAWLTLDQNRTTPLR